ncbi:hypothetical protein T484DRAFT_1829005, partial [Baffinella frigidus]
NGTAPISAGWTSTGLAVRVQFECLAPSGTWSFSELFVQESEGLAGADNAVDVDAPVLTEDASVFKTASVLPAGNVLRVEGLRGTLTQDSGMFRVSGNSVADQVLSRKCMGNGTCSVAFQNFVASGTMVLRATLTLKATCTDLDSASCGEGLDSVRITASSGAQVDLFPVIQRGPWEACVAQCDTQRTRGSWEACVAQCGMQRTVLQGYDVMPLIGKKGSRLVLDIAANKENQYFTCEDATLHVTASLEILVSTLSVASIAGTWSQQSGQLTIPFIPFDRGNVWFHITILLVNAAAPSVSRRPSVSVCAIIPGGASVTKQEPFSAVARRPAVSVCAIPGAASVTKQVAAVLPLGRTGILASATPSSFVTAILTPSTSYTLETNRFTLLLKAQVPSLLPRDLQVTISGLLGSATPDNFFHPLDTVEVRSYECYGSGLCAVTVDATPSEEGALFHRATLDVDIYCTDFFAYPSRFVSSIKACAEASGVTKCPALDNIAIPDTAYSRGPWQGCSDPCMSAQRKVMQSYDLADVLDRYTFQRPTKRFTLAIAASPSVTQSCFSSVFTGGVSIHI